jgi:hypothetical protein
MKLFDTFARRGSARGFHSTVVTTFGVEFAAFEQVLLPQFAGAGAGNVVLLADPGMIALSLTEGMSAPRAAGSEYVVHGVTGQQGVFHPKIAFQVGRDGARVVVGSANATSSGIAGNREIVTEISCGVAQSPERAFVVAVWAYLADLVGETPSPAHDALSWLESRTPWLAEARDDPSVRSWTMADDTRLGFFANGTPETSILDRFVAEIDGAPIERLVVMSPYWDGGLVALRALIQGLRPTETKVLIQAARSLFPVNAAGDLPIELLEATIGKPAVAEPTPSTSGRFSHAKLILATGGGFDHVLSGSANCTLAALGSRRRPGQNAEACVYRRLPAGTIEELLKLTDALTGAPLDLVTLPPMEEEPPIPLEEAVAGSPGAFEAGFIQLNWRPAPGVDVTRASVELSQHPDAEPVLRLEADAWRMHGEEWQATIGPEGEMARFARVRTDGWTSGLAIITRREALRQKRRERTGRGVERAVNEMTGGGLDIRWLEILNQLEKADQDAEAGIARTRRMGRGRPETEAAPHQRLDYETFMKVRRPPASGGGAGIDRNTLAGTSMDVVRTVLNDLVSGGRQAEPEADLSEEELPDDDLGGGGSTNKGRTSHPVDAPPTNGPGKDQEPDAPPPFDPRVYEKAVDAYWTKVRTQAEAGQLGPGHVLRLRLWLMVLLSDRARLVCDGSNAGWPRLIFRVLLAFFGDPTPPIRRLAVDPRYDQLPSDFIEAWVAVIAALDALKECRNTLAAMPDAKGLPAHIDKLDTIVRARIGLTPEDMASGRFSEATNSLNAYLAMGHK